MRIKCRHNKTRSCKNSLHAISTSSLMARLAFVPAALLTALVHMPRCSTAPYTAQIYVALVTRQDTLTHTSACQHAHAFVASMCRATSPQMAWMVALNSGLMPSTMLGYPQFRPRLYPLSNGRVAACSKARRTQYSMRNP